MGVVRVCLMVVVAGVVLASGCSTASQTDRELIHKARVNAEATAVLAANIGTPTTSNWIAAQEWWAAEAATWAALDDRANGKQPPMIPAADRLSEVVTTDVTARR
jgi:hypothetical protein